MDQVDEIIAGIDGKPSASAVGRRMCAMGLSGRRHLALAREVCDRLGLSPADGSLVNQLCQSIHSDDYAEHNRMLSRRWCADNRERSRERSRRWHSENRESSRQLSRRWQAENPARKCLSYSKRRARNADLPFHLTLRNVEWLMAPMLCSVTGLPLSTTWDGDSANPWAPSLDQVEPGVGYHSSNVRVTCWAYNRLKADLDDATVRTFAEALVRGKVTPYPAIGERLLNAKILHYSFSAAKLGGWRKGAKARGLDFDISRNWVDAQMATGVCSLTGLRFSTEVVGHNRKNPLAPSIDRIDNSKGYHPENCRMVVSWYNVGRGDFTDDVVMTVARALVGAGESAH